MVSDKRLIDSFKLGYESMADGIARTLTEELPHGDRRVDRPVEIVQCFQFTEVN